MSTMNQIVALLFTTLISCSEGLKPSEVINQNNNIDSTYKKLQNILYKLDSMDKELLKDSELKQCMDTKKIKIIDSLRLEKIHLEKVDTSQYNIIK